MQYKSIVFVVLIAGALLALATGCTKATEEQREDAQIANDFAQSSATDSPGWQAEEHDVAVDEGLVPPEELAASGENLPPNLTGAEPAEPVDEAGGEPQPGEGEGTPNTEYEGTVFDGAAVYKNAKCSMCHGEEREGTKSAPPLAELSKIWEPGILESYLLDPPAYTEHDVRLKQQAAHYPLAMPAWDRTGEELAALITWLLEEKPIEEPPVVEE
ncbi:cytochrome c [bacterium]|nr:cytochrome c [bacterium]